MAKHTITGKSTEAVVFTDKIDETTSTQIQEIVDQDYMKDLKVRIMPDCHAGKGCVIGTTIKLTDKVVPNHVGVDIGCGVLTVGIGKTFIDFNELDKVIRNKIPHGRDTHTVPHAMGTSLRGTMDKFKVKNILNEDRFVNSLGTLGSGNHFIEVSENKEQERFLTIHTGSRYVGARVAKHYQDLAVKERQRPDFSGAIYKLKQEGRHSEIAEVLKSMKAQAPNLRKDLRYLEGDSMKDYLHDMSWATWYAYVNRSIIADIILIEMGWKTEDFFDTVHNYIDTDNMILRKGAVSAKKGEKLIIPINMRDGSIIAKGKGNDDWNQSAPHGAGRVLSRTKAKAQLDFEDFKSSMSDVWTTSVAEETLDEAPGAYKKIEDILDNIGDTVEILDIIKPLYNFKGVE